MYMYINDGVINIWHSINVTISCNKILIAMAYYTYTSLNYTF